MTHLQQFFCDCLEVKNPDNVIIELAKRIESVINSIISGIPDHKLTYVINTTFAQGIREAFNHYGIKYIKPVHDTLVEAVQIKLEGPNIEREWTEREYDNFVKWKPEYDNI